MRGKSPLVIMELCLMLLVFALAAALCLGGFALAEDISAESEARDRAVSLAQSCAEALKAGSGDFAVAAEELGGEWEGDSLHLESHGLTLRARRLAGGHGLPGLASVTVTDGDGVELFAIDCAWQEGGAENG